MQNSPWDMKMNEEVLCPFNEVTVSGLMKINMGVTISAFIQQNVGETVSIWGPGVPQTLPQTTKWEQGAFNRGMFISVASDLT